MVQLRQQYQQEKMRVSMNLGLTLVLLAPWTVHSQTDSTCSYQREPPLPGVMPSTERPHIILAQGIDYPPFADVKPLSEGGQLTGFGYDVAMGLMDVCDLDIEVTQTDWVKCWGNEVIGIGLDRGYYHGCINYFNAQGIRERYMEFTKPMLNDNVPAALLTRLDKDGNPAVTGLDNLAGKVVVDIPGVAPEGDQLPVVQNYCTPETQDGFENYVLIPPVYGDGPVEDNALRTLLDGQADALWIGAGYAEALACNGNLTAQDTSLNPRDCTLWDGLGTTFAYVHTGMIAQQDGGTTLSMSKIGSGLPDILNPCLEKFLQTETYYELCESYGLLWACFPNDYFPSNYTEAFADLVPLSFTPTNLINTTDCSSGYCPCPSS